MSNEILIEIATTAKQLSEVYKLRYEYSYKEGADEKYAFHETGEYKDEYDTEKAIIIIAMNDQKEIIGTIRLLIKKEADLPYEWCYDYDYVANYLSVSKQDIYQRCALLDRGAIQKDYRGYGLYWKMVDLLEMKMKERKCDVLLGTWIESNHTLALSHVRKSNWVIPEKEYKNSKGNPYYFGFKIIG